MYENPFGQPEEESQPLTTLDYAALGATGIGAGLLGRGLWKSANKVASGVKNAAAGVAHTGPGRAVTEFVGNAADSTFGAAGRKAVEIIDNGAYVNSGVGRVLNKKGLDLTPFVPQKAITFSPVHGFRNEAVNITPEHVTQAFRGLNEDFLAPDVSKLFKATDRITKGEHKLFDEAYGKKLSPEDLAIRKRFVERLKGAAGIGEKDGAGSIKAIDFIHNKGELETILGLLNVLTAKS